MPSKHTILQHLFISQTPHHINGNLRHASSNISNYQKGDVSLEIALTVKLKLSPLEHMA